MPLRSSLFALLLSSILATVAAGKCYGWSDHEDCWKSPPRPTSTKYQKMKPRTGGVLPKFTLDTAFHTMDKEAATKWVATIPVAAGSFADHLRDNVMDAAKDNLIDVLPVAKAFKIGLGILGAVGLDLFGDAQKQPIHLDLTNLFNRLKKNVLDQVDQSKFGDNLQALKDGYATVQDKLQEARDDVNPQDQLDEISFALGKLDYQRYHNIQKAEYVDKYAFYMMEPLVAHASLHFTAVLLRATAQLNAYVQDPKGNRGMNTDVCTDLEDFSKKLEAYKTWYGNYWTKAYDARVGKVPTKPGCGGKCELDCSGAFCMQTKSVDYTWQDSWPLLQMQEHKEGWGCDVAEGGGKETVMCSGIDTDGSGLRKDVTAYVSDMKVQLGQWKNNLDATMQSLVDGMNKLTSACNSGSLTLV